jgi:branched-chain amino acid transport system substrate-binding protein
VLALAACTPAATPTSAPPPPKPKTVTLGFTWSQTGKLNVEALSQYNGLSLWLKHVNEAGGIRLSDGSVITFKAVTYDDESNPDRVRALYTELATEDNVDFLISPYSSGLADVAAGLAERHGKLMITAGSSADSTHKKGYKLVFQTLTPASKFLTGAAELLEHLDPAARRIAIVYENEKFATDVATALQDYAKAQGFQVVLFEKYASDTTDFLPFISKLAASQPDAIMGGGHYADTSLFAKQLAEQSVTAKFVALLVAPPDPKFAELGEAALGIVGPSQWEPQVQYSPEAAQAAGLPWFGPSVNEFLNAYRATYSQEPSYRSAGAYAAGLMLQRAIETADSLELEKVKAALEAMDMMVFYGRVKFDTSPDQHGLQIGHEMVYVQWQKDAAGNLSKHIVWPEAARSVAALYPAP